ncbi:MAG: FAD-binding protein [Ardenticatenia bacterium]|nr:FAD-binding protein [Ardenticatenia bacterium]
MRAVIVGGGIGGLAAAIALQQAGLEVRVLEQAGSLRAAGAGLWLWPNALAALDRLGALGAVRMAGRGMSTAGSGLEGAGIWRASEHWTLTDDP